MVSVRLAIGLVAAAAALSAGHARAQDNPPVGYEGGWSRSGQSIQADITSWGPNCGPRPRSGGAGSGGHVSIRQADRELVISGGPRTERSDGCWSMNPRVRRASHSQSEGRWRTTCRTATDDPKFEEGTYTLRATSPTTIVYREESHYNWRLDGDHCEARIVVSWTYSRASPTPPPLAAQPQEPPAPEPPPDRCASRGEPARVVLESTRRRVEAGEHVCVRARVADANGCDTATDLRVESPDVTMVGTCFDVPLDAEDGKRLRVRASAGSLHAETTLTVQSLDITGYLAARVEKNGTNTQAPGELRAARAQSGGLRTDTQSTAGEPILWLVLVIAAIALLVLGVAAFLFRQQRRVATRRRRPDPADRAQASSVAAARPRTGLVCPTCHSEFEPGSQFCPHDASRLTDVTEDPRAGAVCPRCHLGFESGTRFCPHDSEELVPFSAYGATHPLEHRHRGEKGKICPSCAARYELDATFCGKDGSELVLVN